MTITRILLIIFLTILTFGISTQYSFSKDGHEGHDHSSHDHSDHGSSDKKFYIHGGFKFHFETITEAHEKKEEVDESYTHSHLQVGVNLGNNLSLMTDVKIEGEGGGHSHGGAAATPEDKFFEDHKHDYLVAHQSGGRLIINNNVLFFSTGDFRYRILAQDKSRDVGKLVSINLDTNEKKIKMLWQCLDHVWIMFASCLELQHYTIYFLSD